MLIACLNFSLAKIVWNEYYYNLNEISLEIHYHRDPQDYTLHFVPVNGAECSASNPNYAFCSPVFTIEVLLNGIVVTALPLKLDMNTQVFSIFPPPHLRLNPNDPWRPDSNGKFKNDQLGISIEIKYTPGNELKITLK